MPSPRLSSTTTDSSSSFTVGPRSVNAGADSAKSNFVDRRNSSGSESGSDERRQFGSSHVGLSDDGRELALAIDQYKMRHHRRYLTCDEMLTVLRSLGYEK
jgi:hypothetical protein